MAKHHWQPPRLPGSVKGEARRVTWLELFYDLVYVATLIQLGDTLSEDVSVPGFLRFAVLFVHIWWAWSGVTFYMNRFVVDDIWHRLMVFLQIVAIAALGISVGGAFGELAAQFAIAYASIRAILIVLYLRTWRSAPETRPLTVRFMVGWSIGTVLWLISVFMPMPWAGVMWLVALAIEFGNDLLPQTRAVSSLLPADPHHMRERYGIFVIVVLGESFIKSISAAAGTPINGAIIYYSLLGIFAVVALWWLYFDTAETTEIKPTGSADYVWIYAHLPLTLAITAFGVAAKKILLEVGQPVIYPEYVRLYSGALVLYALALLLIDMASRPSDNRLEKRLRFASPLLIIAAFGALAYWNEEWSPLVFITLTAVIMVTAIAFDVLSEPIPDTEEPVPRDEAQQYEA